MEGFFESFDLLLRFLFASFDRPHLFADLRLRVLGLVQQDRHVVIFLSQVCGGLPVMSPTMMPDKFVSFNTTYNNILRYL